MPTEQSLLDIAIGLIACAAKRPRRNRDQADLFPRYRVAVTQADDTGFGDGVFESGETFTIDVDLDTSPATGPSPAPFGPWQLAQYPR